jgi:hypothetical protein
MNSSEEVVNSLDREVKATTNCRNEEEENIFQWNLLSNRHYLLGPTVKVVHAIENTS